MGWSAGGAVAVAAAIANAIKASGAIVRLEPQDFLLLIAKCKNPLLVVAQGGLLKPNYQYLLPYKGLVFFTKSPSPLQLPSDVELITARKIWVPD